LWQRLLPLLLQLRQLLQLLPQQLHLLLLCLPLL
jgi:hypothetical protein